MQKQIDREELKQAIKEILVEDTQFVKEIIRELLIENNVIVSEEQSERRERLQAMIEEDFDRYDPVFRDLA